VAYCTAIKYHGSSRMPYNIPLLRNSKVNDGKLYRHITQNYIMIF